MCNEQLLGERAVRSPWCLIPELLRRSSSDLRSAWAIVNGSGGTAATCGWNATAKLGLRHWSCVEEGRGENWWLIREREGEGEGKWSADQENGGNWIFLFALHKSHSSQVEKSERDARFTVHTHALSLSRGEEEREWEIRIKKWWWEGIAGSEKLLRFVGFSMRKKKRWRKRDKRETSTC